MVDNQGLCEQIFRPGHPAVEIKFIHSSGPGGQNVNKVATAVQLRFDPAVFGLSELQAKRLRGLAGRQFSQEGLVIITARNHRSQLSNRQEALARLYDLLIRALAPPPRSRKATKPGLGAVERRLSAKKLNARNKAARSKVRADGD